MKILCAISGGVDSAVMAALLQQEGNEIIGVHLKFWSENFQAQNSSKQPENKCCSLEASEAARTVAEKLKIPFYVLNFREDFKQKVVDYFLKTYAQNKTPNPCAICNREIKFGKLLQKMKELDCEKLATGHYTRIRGGKLLRGIDETKDQSYFLSRLTSEKLKNVLFPLGEMQKDKVKKLAQKFGFVEIENKKESQGTCFFAEKDPHDFLVRNLPKKILRSGNIRILDGEIIGKHDGLPLYTIGQRRGVKLGGMDEPFYVAGFDLKKNELIVCKDKKLFTKKLKAKNLSWLGEIPKNGEKLLAQIRYRNEAAAAKIFFKKTFSEVEFEKPQRAITPGQIVAFYHGKTCLGSGEIC